MEFASGETAVAERGIVKSFVGDMEMRKNVFVSGLMCLMCALAAGAASADLDCGVGRVAVSIDATVTIAPEQEGCALLDRTLVVRRFFPTSDYLFSLGVPGTCFTGVIYGTATIGGGSSFDIIGTSLSAQYAGQAFKVFDPVPDDSDPTRVVFATDSVAWLAGEANTYVELTKANESKPFLKIAFDDTFFFTQDGNDTEKFVAVSPGVSGTLVAEGPIFWPGAPLNGWLCVATSILN